VSAVLRRLGAVAAVAAVVLAALLATGLARADHFGGAYGLTAGTSSRYCSLELSPAPHVSCEAAS
jgi:hypothetical protein